ncbi:hypothetical protein BC939DRAFT_498829 [Gamsiella multidivaricata]|uniref:uncharacterized protein n=1 Tax=Gamsiella multidivaricata TaxID=101098 RepID=UPI002220EB26|nr:uncharacterized protein BC939DRAFT_498829 [Gamsiella multidivaricata]KAI7831380.1 hypothetical protein BC939DRAFT_498829 [Gamsiella multidivaricata]
MVIKDGGRAVAEPVSGSFEIGLLLLDLYEHLEHAYAAKLVSPESPSRTALRIPRTRSKGRRAGLIPAYAAKCARERQQGHERANHHLEELEYTDLAPAPAAGSLQASWTCRCGQTGYSRIISKDCPKNLNALSLARWPFAEDLVTGVEVPRPYAILSPWLCTYTAHLILLNYGKHSLITYLRIFSLYVAGDRPNAEEDAKSAALFHVNEILKGAENSLAVYEEMPRDFRNLINRQPNCDELGQHAELDPEALAAEAAHDFDLCNDDQKALYAAITAAPDNKDEGVAKVFFIDALGGTGKSFLYNALIAHIRGRHKKDVIIVASSGIAAQEVAQPTRFSKSRSRSCKAQRAIILQVCSYDLGRRIYANQVYKAPVSCQACVCRDH